MTDTWEAPVDRPAAGLTWVGGTALAGSTAAMLATGWWLWDRLPETVVTREAQPGVTATEVAAPVLVLAGPVVLLLIALAMAGSVWLGRGVLSRQRAVPDRSPRTTARAMDGLALLLGPFLVVVHGAALADAAGLDPPLERVLGVAVGVVLAGIGNLMPKLGPDRLPDTPDLARLVRVWRGVQRTGGLLMAGLGLLTVAGSLLLPPWPVALVASLLVAGVFALLLVLALRRASA